MKIKFSFRQFIYFVTLFFIMFVPKINLFNIPGTSTGIRIEDFLILLSFITYVLTSKNKKINYKKNKNIVYVFVFYILVCIISTLFGSLNNYVSISMGIVYTMRKIEYFVMFFIGYEFSMENEKFDKLLKISVIFNFFIVLLQKFQIIGSFRNAAYGNLITDRFSSIFTGSYELTSFLLLIMPFIFLKNIKIKVKDIFYLSIILIILVLSESRTSMMLFFLMIVLMFIREKGKNKFNFVLYIIFGSIFVFYLLLNGNLLSFLPRTSDLNLKNVKNAITYSWNNRSIYDYIHNYSSIPVYPYGDLSFNIRIKNWLCLIDGFIKNPILGMGMSIVRNASDGGYVRLLSEVGVLGAFAWLTLLKKIYNHLKTDNYKFKSYRYCIISILLGAVFIDLFDASKIMCMFWFILGYVLKEEKSNEKNSNI